MKSDQGNQQIDAVMAMIDKQPGDQQRMHLRQWLRVAISASIGMEMLKQLALQQPEMESALVLACVKSYEQDCEQFRSEARPS